MNWYPQNSPIRPYQKQEVWFYKPAFLGYPGCHSCNLKWLVTLAKMRGEELVMGWLVDSQAGSKRFTLQVGSASPFINLTVDGGIWAISKDQTTRGQRKMMVGGDTGILPKWPWIGLRLHNKFAQIGSPCPPLKKLSSMTPLNSFVKFTCKLERFDSVTVRISLQMSNLPHKKSTTEHNRANLPTCQKSTCFAF